MKLVATIIVVCFLFGSVGCSNNRTIKGVLIEVDRKIYSNCWKLLKFEGGLEIAIRSQYAEEWYIGHYQEITVTKEGVFISNKCKSYDDLVSDFKKRDYKPPALVKVE